MRPSNSGRVPAGLHPTRPRPQVDLQVARVRKWSAQINHEGGSEFCTLLGDRRVDPSWSAYIGVAVISLERTCHCDSRAS